jgi:peptidoglycan/LPS O-acetylase OafA/YrhL
MTGHCTEAFFPNFAAPADDVDSVPHLFQRPFLRLFVAGPFWLAVFFLLSGYVCALKPLRLFRDGRLDDGRRAIESSAFRRVPRLVVPTTAATILIWTLSQFGAFEAAQHAESDWLRRTVPPKDGFVGLITNCV